MAKVLKEYRCTNCKKLFFRANLVNCELEVKCKNCKEMNVIKSDLCSVACAVVNKISNEETISLKEGGEDKECAVLLRLMKKK